MSRDSALSEAIEWQLVVTLYDQTAILIVGGVALFTAAIVGWFEVREPWLLWWAAATVIVLCGRLGLQFAFARGCEDPDRVRKWRGRFTVGAGVMGILLGCAALGITTHVDPFVLLLLLCVQLVIVIGAAARNAGCPSAVRAQVLLSLVPLLIASCYERHYWILGFFIVFETFAALALARHSHRRTVRLLRLDEENIALVRAVREANAQLECANRQLAAAATTDALTGIANRRRFDAALAEESPRAAREGTDLSLLMIDIDSFKQFNDLYGHQAGDDCLRRVAETLAQALRRPADVVARYGGEELAAILPQTGTAAAAALAERIRADVAGLAIGSAAGVRGALTVSVGVATAAAGIACRPEDLLRAADAALYTAKNAGRNCVRIADSSRLPV